MPALFVKNGPLAGRLVSVDSALVLGRRGADLDIDDPLISRRHAAVRRTAEGLEIEDLGSRNGTWVDGRRIVAATPVPPGTVIAVGTTRIEVHADVEEVDGTTAAARSPAEDELRPVTALFADLVGSTRLGERLAPDEVKVVVGECVTRMTRMVERFGGTLQAYLGDGIAAFFGLPTAHEDDPERAARAALAILEVVGSYSREVEAAWGIPDLEVRVGINTGESAVGLVGAGSPQLVSLGDTTNVAARLQTVAAPGSVAIGPTTARCLVNRFELEALGDVAVKGRDQPVEAWRLVCPRESARVGVPSAIVGRAPELARLGAIVEELAVGRGHILLLLGDAGIGKTRLLSELRGLVAERATWLEGRCRSYGTELLYGPFVEMLRGWAGVGDDEASLSIRTRLAAKVALLGPSTADDTLPSLARLLGLEPPHGAEEPAQRPPPAALATEIRGAFRRFVLGLAGQGPVVVAIEDAQWADSATRELAEDLLDLPDAAPVLLVTTVRLDPGSEGWRLRVRVLSDFAHRAGELRLAPLDESDAKQLLAGLPASRALDGAAVERILERAEGNPLYLEELANAFAHDEPRRGRTWAPTASGGRILTPTLESLLVARIDRLPLDARRLAQAAAVVGRTFRIRVLERLVRRDGLERDLAVLMRAGVVGELRRYPEPEFAFKHGLLREASLSTLPVARRRELYREVGEAFEALGPETSADHLELVGHYFARSDDPARALPYLERAAARAAGLDAEPWARELWSRALKVAAKVGDAEAAARARAGLGEPPGA